MSWWTPYFFASFICFDARWTYIISSLCFATCHLFSWLPFFGFVSPFVVYTHAGQVLLFFVCNFFVHSLSSCGLGVWLFVCDFAVCNLYSSGQEFDSFLFFGDLLFTIYIPMRARSMFLFMILPFVIYTLVSQKFQIFFWWFFRSQFILLRARSLTFFCDFVFWWIV